MTGGSFASSRFARRLAIAVVFLASAGPTRSADAAPQGTAARPESLAALQSALERLRTELSVLQGEIQRLTQEASRSREPGLDARLTSLEQRQKAIEAELARLLGELKLMSEALDQASENDRKRPTMTVYGTLQASRFEGQKSILDAEAFELVLSGRPHPRLSFFAEIEFERAASVGGPRGGEIVMEQAYASYTFAPALSVRTGVLLVPFGNVNVDHFAPLRDVVRKPLVSYAVAPSDWTDNGVQIAGRRVLGAAWLIDYEAAVIAGLDSRITSVGTRAARQAFGVDNNDNKALVGRLAVKRGSGFETGVSGYTGKYDDANMLNLDGWAVDLRAELGPLRLTGEYDHFAAAGGSRPTGHLRGYYARASYDIRGAWLRAIAKDFDDPRLTLVVQYDWTRIEGLSATSSAESNRETGLTVGLAYRPSRQWVAKVNREVNKATNRARHRGTVDGWLASVGFVF